MKSIIAFDIESTGTNPSIDRIVQLSMIKLSFPELIEIERKKTLINPLIPIPKEASEVHGIKDDDVQDKPTFKQISKSALSFLSTCDLLLTHNGKSFDRTLLYEEFLRVGLEWIPQPMIDTYVIMSNKQPRTLEGAYKFYCEGKEIEGAHDAENDVLATIEVLKGQINRYGFDSYLNLIKENEEHAKEGFQDLYKVLISESKYKNEDRRLSWDGKIALNNEDKPVLTFGKWKDIELNKIDLGYINFILTGDFPSNTKNVLKSLYNK